MTENNLRGIPPEVSFIIPCYECRRTLGFTLKSIFAQKTDLSYEVIIVDSSIHSVKDWINLQFRKVRLITSPERLFPGAARNLGASASNGKFLAFLDADTVALPNWLATLHGQLERQSDLAAVGGAIYNGNPERFASKIQYWIEFSEFLPGLPAGQRPFLSSSNILIRREAFERTGGFDPELAMAEDLLLMRSLEGRIFFESGTGIRHSHRSRWSLVGAHLNSLGYWSGLLRSRVDLSGSWLRNVPWLTFALPIYRAPLIIRRIWRSEPHQAILAALHAPFLVAGLYHWTAGFFRGLRS